MSARSLLRRLPWSSSPEKDVEKLYRKEWLVANGLGGYASGSISGACTRRYHGLLIAALPAPLGRMMMFNELAEELRLPDGRLIRLDADDRRLFIPSPEGDDRPPPIHSDEPSSGAALGEFRLETGLPVWTYEVEGVLLEKRVLLPHLQNTVFLSYHLLDAPAAVRLRLRPSLHFRPHESSVAVDFPSPYAIHAFSERIEIRSDIAPPLRMRAEAEKASLVLDGGSFREIQYYLERARGYDYKGRLWSPGYFRFDLQPGQSAVLAASTEDWEVLMAIDAATARQAELERRQRLVNQAHPHARKGRAAELVLAADQFIIRPTTRVADAAVANAAGDDIRTVIAGYHWFTDWGRDTMISLEGLTLSTGRKNEAGYLLRTFARYVRDGLIPNLFPEGQREGLYHTADATLWYFHALYRYLQETDDEQTLEMLLPVLTGIVAHHVQGTHFGIRVDESDGLLTQGQPGYQLTWMDAKVGDWVVTPRRGKAVEINALWYNALRLLEAWTRQLGDSAAADSLHQRAARVKESFNLRFWNSEGGYLFDVLDGEDGPQDDSFRPNQLFAISLDYPVLNEDYWRPVVDNVEARLLTPVGLRSLAPGHRDYKPKYDGDLRARDAAYHQGTVWAWLIGPFIDAYLRVYPGRVDRARELLAGFETHLDDACIGSISEIFDAETPYHPRGCVAQAWSVAEVLRCWIKTSSAADDLEDSSLADAPPAAKTPDASLTTASG